MVDWNIIRINWDWLEYGGDNEACNYMPLHNL